MIKKELTIIQKAIIIVLILFVIFIVFLMQDTEIKKKMLASKNEAEKAPQCKIVKESELKNVIFTNDLNMKIIPGKSIVYSDGFQKAWNKLAADLKCSTLEIEDGPDYVSVLNNNIRNSYPANSEDLYYTSTGKIENEINSKINADLSKKYGITIPEMEIKSESDSVHLFSCFHNYVKFKTPFIKTGTSSIHLDNYRTGFFFDENYGTKYYDVKTFGINEWTCGSKIITMNNMIRRFIYVKPMQTAPVWKYKMEIWVFYMLIDTKSGDELYISTDPSPITRSKLSTKYSLIDVCNDTISLLTDTDNFLNNPQSFYERRSIKVTEISHRDSIKIPIINFDYIIYHDKLTDKIINKKFKLCTPVQRIMFNTNSEEDYYYQNPFYSLIDNVQKKYPDKFECYGSFMIFLKRKTETKPYFIVYIDNDELLTK